MADVDKLKKALVVFIDLAEGVDDALEDGKVSLAEGIAIGVNTIPGGAEIWKNKVELLEEIKDLDSAEITEINAFIALEFSISNTKAEAVVEKAIAFVLGGVDLIGAIKDLKKDDGEE